MAQSLRLELPDATATEAAGARLADAFRATAIAGFKLYLEGDLGAGKTTLVRGFLRRLGHGGRVPSPTYTLVEPYVVAGLPVYHVDLYRIRDPAELDDLGLGDALAGEAVLLVEWPDHGAGRLPGADISVRLAGHEGGRTLICEAHTPDGSAVLDRV